MKILHVIDSLCGGGAEKLLNDILPLIQGENNICKLLVLSSKDDKYSESLRKNGISVNFVQGNNLVSQFFHIVKYIRNSNFDIVHAHLFPTIYICAFLKFILGRKAPCLIMTEHNTDNRRRHHRAFRFLEKYIYSKYDHVISISPEVEEALLKWLKEKKNPRFSIIDNGIVIDNFFEAPRYKKQEIWSDFTEEDILLCMVGSFTDQKNHAFLLEVMKCLPDQFKLMLVGEGEKYDEIKNLATQNNLNDRVMFLGFRKDVSSLINTADIVVIPSAWEGFGLSAVEALACGKPIVASDVPGLAQVIGDCGKKVELGNKEEFAEAIQNSVKYVADVSYSVRCRKRAKKYDIKKMAENYLTLYESMIQKRVI